MVTKNATFNFEGLAVHGLSELHKKVVASLVGIIGKLPENTVQIACMDRSPQWYEVEISPSNPRAARIVIYLCIGRDKGDDPDAVVVNAGRDIAIDIVDIQYDQAKPDVVGLFEDVVGAILEGRVRETLYFRGETLYRSRCWVGTPDPPIELDRTNVPNWLRSLGKQRRKETFDYEPYFEC